MVARLKLQATSRELLLALEQCDRPLEHGREIHEGVVRQEPLVLSGGNRGDAQQPTRQNGIDLLGEHLEGRMNAWGECGQRCLVPSPRLGTGKMRRQDWFRDFLPRRPALRQKVPLQTSPELLDASPVVCRKVTKRRQVCGEPSKQRRASRSVGKKRFPLG